MSPNLRQTEKKMTGINWSSDCTTNRLPIPKSNVRILSSFFEFTNLALAKMARYCLVAQFPETVRSAKSWLKQINSYIFFYFKIKFIKLFCYKIRKDTSFSATSLIKTMKYNI